MDWDPKNVFMFIIFAKEALLSSSDLYTYFTGCKQKSLNAFFIFFIMKWENGFIASLGPSVFDD